MGWNQVEFSAKHPVLSGVQSGASFYFVHSYYPEPAEQEIIAATTGYGVTFASALWRGGLMATQFHPEKSQRVGLAMIGNFINFVGSKP